MKRTNRRLTISRETIRGLTDLTVVHGGLGDSDNQICSEAGACTQGCRTQGQGTTCPRFTCLNTCTG